MKAKEQFIRIGLPVIAVLASIGVGFAGVTSAQSANTTNAASSGPFAQMRGMSMHGERPAVFGKVTAISGNTLTVADQEPGKTSVSNYTVNATNAKVMKGTAGSPPAESGVSSIAVGDQVAVRGTVSGTTVTATEIMDGIMMHGRFDHGGKGTHGTVSGISGTTITLTSLDGKTYTVDASSAQIGKITRISVGDVKVGDMLDVMGDVSGTNVTAKHIMDGAPQR